MIRQDRLTKTDALRSQQPRIGDVFMVCFDGTGSVQQGYRPAVVFSNNLGNTHSPTVIVLPLTTSLKKVGQPTHVLLDAERCGLKRTSMVLAENPQCVSKESLGKLVAHLDDEMISKVAVAYVVASSGISFLDFNTLVSTWETSVRLNAA